MKITVVTDEAGELLASVFGHVSEHAARLGEPRHYQDQEEPLATLVCQPGQVLLEVEVPDEYEKLPPDELHQALRKSFCS